MRRTGLVVFLVVLAALLVFTSCAKPEDQNQGDQQQVTEESTVVTWFTLEEVPNPEPGKWYWFQDGEMFTKPPILKADGTVVATRTELTGGQYNDWKAQLLRFYDPSKTNYTVKLSVKANQDATIPYYFGCEPYVDEAHAVRDSFDVSTEATEVTLELTRDFDVPKFLKLSFEIGNIPGIVLEIKLATETAN
ncbi:hypothetical protein QQE94_02285 [Fervidobacterium pennivorans subsp. shakshaketiis]|uniref:Lipoprotein n=1 Tax=Fervidobacterium pennivorans (strain DSM 9078 / Ven5) TaxID=771875 RepID=H9UAP8_FERPD|nr:hypothetical protein [Fervidobacterium pennivorans]AFG34591.1 hypothetical protein Ferpe_0451 [Fervidobacterium pennivorans DSM 9078]QIV77915.1 hypothetical protein HER11_02210 [Fervidobacterium pennivorans subsp. keratinolyticus]